MEYQKENNIKKTEMLTNVNEDDNEKEKSKVNHVTEIKIENNTFSSKLIDSEHNHFEFENTVIKMKQEDQFFEENIEENFVDALVNQDEIENVVSQNNINFKANEIKKENENQDFEENLHKRYDNILGRFDSYNDDVKIKVEENYDYSLYSEKSTNDPLINLHEMKIDIIENDIESVNDETNVKYKSEDIEESSVEDHVIPSEEEDETNKEVNVSYKILKAKKKKTLLRKKSKQKMCGVVNRKDKIVKKHECSICKKNFPKLSSLECHMRIHTGEKPHKCDICQKKFTKLIHLTCHMRIHTGQTPHKCEVCHKKFTVLASLIRHKIIHTGKKPYECDICQKKFIQSFSLMYHKKIHTGENLYECSVCQKKFIQPSHLRTHTLIHTGVKPYECDVCQQEFSDSSSRRRHMLIHTGEKPHECDVCQKKFSQASDLRRHTLIHTEEKPHGCDVCQKKFIRLDYLKKHMRIHTGERIHNDIVITDEIQ